MRALISGQAAVAVFIDGEQIYSICLDEPERYVEREVWEVPLLFADTNDIQQLDNEPQSKILEALEIAWQKDRSLQLILILIDPNEDTETRLLAAECIEDFLNNISVKEYVANRLYSAPLPSSADLAGAIQQCTHANLTITRNFLNTLYEDQAEIYRRHSAWEQLPTTLFGGPDEKREFHFDAVRYGAFRMFATERGKKNWALIQLLAHPYFRGKGLARKVFQEWAAPFKESATNTEFEPKQLDDFEAEIDAEERNFKRAIRPHEAFEQAEKQRETIKELLVQGNQDLALRFTQQLISSQRQTSAPVHIAKSLCDLAQFAKKLGSPELQLHFAKLAIEEAPSDGWSYATVADAYRALTEYQMALDAYHKAGVFGDSRASLIGRAEVLKDLGQLDDSLKILEKCAKDHPHNVVARNARAAALADFGKLTEALEAYNKILDEWPYEHVTRSGRAQVLRSLGLLNQSLIEFDEIVREYPHESIPQYTRAEVLKELGRLEDSLEAYADLIRKFPLAAEMRVGHARTLRDLGRFDDAIEEFKQVIQSHPLHPFAYTGLAETYKKTGNLSAALETYRDVLHKFPRVLTARNGMASVLVAQENYKEAMRFLPVNLPASFGEWIGYHIRGIAEMRSGKLKGAERIFEWGLKENPWILQRQYFQTALASVRIQQKRFSESINLIQNVIHPTISPVARVISMHAFGELGKKPEFQQAYDNIPETSAPIVISLRDALAKRYFNQPSSGYYQAESWLFEHECNSLLLAA